MASVGRFKGIRLDSRKGQYILMDEDVCSRQVDYAKLKKEETVLEIGCGLGALTHKLAARAKKVVAIEKDRAMCSYIEKQVPSNVEVINADVLKIDLPAFDVVVSNLPYQISSKITFKLLDTPFKRGILMYQKEFAERMCATHGSKEYSRLSVNVQYKADCMILEEVSKNAFYPVPEVDSAIIELVPRKSHFSVSDETIFFKIVEVLFSKRRKKIRNSLENYFDMKLGRIKDVNKGEAKGILQKVPYGDLRVEVLSPQQIGEIADFIYSLLEDRK